MYNILIPKLPKLRLHAEQDSSLLWTLLFSGWIQSTSHWRWYRCSGSSFPLLHSSATLILALDNGSLLQKEWTIFDRISKAFPLFSQFAMNTDCAYMSIGATTSIIHVWPLIWILTSFNDDSVEWNINLHCWCLALCHLPMALFRIWRAGLRPGVFSGCRKRSTHAVSSWGWGYLGLHVDRGWFLSLLDDIHAKRTRQTRETRRNDDGSAWARGFGWGIYRKADYVPSRYIAFLLLRFHYMIVTSFSVRPSTTCQQADLEANHPPAFLSNYTVRSYYSDVVHIEDHPTSSNIQLSPRRSLDTDSNTSTLCSGSRESLPKDGCTGVTPLHHAILIPSWLNSTELYKNRPLVPRPPNETAKFASTYSQKAQMAVVADCHTWPKLRM